MGFIGRLLLNVALWGVVRYAEKQAKSRLSEQKAKELRRYIEDRLHKAAGRKQKGKLAETDIDDTALRFCQIVMKSRWLDQKIRAEYPAH
jgi:hypothetical protein